MARPQVSLGTISEYYNAFMFKHQAVHSSSEHQECLTWHSIVSLKTWILSLHSQTP